MNEAGAIFVVCKIDTFAEQKTVYSVLDIRLVTDSNQIFGYLQNRSGQKRALVVFTPVVE